MTAKNLGYMLDLNHKFRTLGTLRPIIIKDVLETCWAEEGLVDKRLHEALDNLDGLKIIGESLGLEIDNSLFIAAPDNAFTFEAENAIVSAPIDPHRFVSTLAVICMQEDKLPNYIENAYGETPSL